MFDIITQLGDKIMIYEEIKKANIQAMKDKDQTARAIYSVVLNKIMLENINKKQSGGVTDADVSNILQKTIKELNEEKENFLKVNNIEKVHSIEHQQECIKGFLPQMMSEEEIYNIISAMEDKSIGSVMKKFKSEYNGKCDMKLVSEILKRF